MVAERASRAAFRMASFLRASADLYASASTGDVRPMRSFMAGRAE
jgi:hypothetical protein